MSTSATVFPASVPSLGASRPIASLRSRRGSTSFNGMRVSSNRIRDHLAALRPCRPAADDRRKLAGGTAGDDQMNRLRRAEFPVARLAIDFHGRVRRNLLSALAAVGVSVRAHRHAGPIEQKLANVLFTPSVAPDG